MAEGRLTCDLPDGGCRRRQQAELAAKCAKRGPGPLFSLLADGLPQGPAEFNGRKYFPDRWMRAIRTAQGPNKLDCLVIATVHNVFGSFRGSHLVRDQAAIPEAAPPSLGAERARHRR